MDHLRQLAARERRAPIYWWLGLMVGTGGFLVAMVHDHSPVGAALLAVLLAIAWTAPLVALQSLSAPRRPLRPPPAPGGGTYAEWRQQAHLLGRLLLNYEDVPHLPPDMRRQLREARADLRDTLRAHPLRDDLERACGRIRVGAVRKMKEWLWLAYRSRIREIVRDYERQVAGGSDEDARRLAFRAAVESSAARMTHYCMPRMLERQRLACAVDCAWLAATADELRGQPYSPIELAAAFVILWSDFSEPWRPASAIRRVQRYLQEGGELAFAEPEPPAAAEPAAAPAAAPERPEDGDVVIRNGKRYRRVRVKHARRHRHLGLRGPSLLEILLSFGQWLRYSLRSWTLYR